MSVAPEDNTSIRYRDENGQEWLVGAAAQDSISASDTTAGSLSAYGRHRYYSPMFKVLFRTGIAAGLTQNQYGDPEGKLINIQTGLPPRYLNDETDLRDVIMTEHHFEVKFGDGPWKKYDIDLKSDNNIMPALAQPIGTLVSIATNKNFQPSQSAAAYFTQKMLLMDGGFGTMDYVPIKKGQVTLAECETDETLGMKRVLSDTATEIFKQYGFEVSVPAMQQYLETGVVPAKTGRVYKKMPFDELLEKNSRRICELAINKAMDVYPLQEYHGLIITGGTCAAWSNFIRENEFFREGDVIEIISGNQGDPDLPYIFSNVRGYYIFGMTNYRG